jgi:hypothetical protein
MSTRRAGLAMLALAALMGLFWKLRVLDTASSPAVSVRSLDLYIEHHPAAAYAARVLRAGSLPIWNPYQLAGIPFAAVPYPGIFYPPNLVYLLFDTAVATELSQVAHLMLAALGMWGLGRALGFAPLGSFVAALTFSWSGWMMFQVNVTSAINCMCWLPFTALQVARAARGKRVAHPTLALAVAAQLLCGAPEYAIYNLEAAGLLAPVLLFDRDGRWRRGCIRGAGLLASVLLGVGLAGVQLLPSLELARLGARMGGTLSLEAARGQIGFVADYLPLPAFLAQAAGGLGMASVGCLPFVGWWLGASDRARRGLWLYALLASALAMLLVSGGPLFDLYHQTPFGRSFRRPVKFLQIFGFAQALLAGLALTCLDDWRRRASPFTAWRSPAWLLCLAAMAGLALVAPGRGGPWTAAVLLLLVLFGIAPGQRLRHAGLAALALVQAANLFLGARNPDRRPIAQAGIFDRHAALLEELRDRSEGARTYLSASLLGLPDLSMNQGTLRELRTVVAYQPLAMRRSGEFFRAASRAPGGRDPFVGDFALAPDSRFDLMDLASTRFYLVRRGEDLDRFLARAAREPDRSGFRSVSAAPDVNVYERAGFVPRASLVGGARVFATGEAALSALLAPGFDPRREVLLEADSGAASSPAPPPGPVEGSARIRIDEPERVVVDVRAGREAYLLLTDAWYPGWEARLDGRPVPVLRADHLFRAVRVPAGRSELCFEYRPASLRQGAAVSAVSGLIWIALIGRARRRARPDITFIDD